MAGTGSFVYIKKILMSYKDFKKTVTQYLYPYTVLTQTNGKGVKYVYFNSHTMQFNDYLKEVDLDPSIEPNGLKYKESQDGTYLEFIGTVNDFQYSNLVILDDDGSQFEPTPST